MVVTPVPIESECKDTGVSSRSFNCAFKRYVNIDVKIFQDYFSCNMHAQQGAISIEKISSGVGAVPKATTYF